MKLLIVTQAVDAQDPILGFFTRWIEEFAKRYERVEVICLYEGKHTLPANVRVHSLGKERGAASRAAYGWRFLSLAWRLRRDYDAVFVHMNQEYVLIAGPLWKLLGKSVYLWRNHYAGSWETGLAAAFSTKVFCTSKTSYTAKYKKTVLMPVGVDTERFSPDTRAMRKARSVLFLSRMAPSKRPEILISALALLATRGIEFSADFYGSPFPKDELYYKELIGKTKALGMKRDIAFHPGVPNSDVANVYRAHEIFVNTSPTGMLDKTLFEAAACGCQVFAMSEDFAEAAGEGAHFSSPDELADRIESALVKPPTRTLSEVVAKNSLDALFARLVPEIK